MEQGNIDPNARPIVKNEDGSYSTVRSMSFENNGGQEVLVPTVSPDGKIMDDQAAMELYGKTGQNLGKFDNPAHADMYAEALHKAQDQHYGAAAQSTAAPAIPPGFKVVQPASMSAKGDRVGKGSFGAPSAPANGPWTKYRAAAAQSPNVFDQFDQPVENGPWAGFPDASPIEVNAPDGTTVRFPAGTSDDVMTKAMRETFGGPAAPALPPGFKVVPPAGGNNIESLIRGTEQAPGAPALTPHSAPVDFAYSMAAGVPRGAVEMGMLPVTAARAAKGGLEWLQDKTENSIRELFGYDPVSPEDVAKDRAAADDTALGHFLTRMFDGQDAIRDKMDDTLYEPRTRLGKFGRTIGEFATPGSLAGKADTAATTGREVARNVAENAVGNVVLPAVASEAGGQATEGTQYEGLMRFLGAALGNAGTAFGRSYNAPESVVRRATSEMTDDDWRRALGLQNNTTGVRLTGPEAIAQATNGASALPNILRVVEGSVDGRARTAPFFAQRPAQVDTAVGNVLDQIAPPSAQPSTLGPRAAEVASNVIDSTRQDINAQTRPLYDAAQHETIPQAQFGPIAADPRFVAGLARLRGNAELAPDYAHLPDHSIGVVDAVTKDLNARGEALSSVANPLYGPELASRSTGSAVAARNAATNHSPAYAQALAEQEALRRSQLNPLEQGPVGRVAAARDTAGAGNAILPQNPLTGSAGEATVAARRLVAEDPATTAALVRQNLADRFSKANTETQEGLRDFAGAKFHKDVAGNDVRQEVLDAVLREIPGGQAATSTPELLDVLQATGRRKQIGSATEFNRSMNADLGGAASPVGVAVSLVKSLGTSIVKAGDVAKRAALRSNLKTLADMFIDPRSVELIRDANGRGFWSGLGEALARTGAETGGTLIDPGQR
ncbi:hypothetical protein NKI78_27035 [Mesorhizobium sp. M0400]|uniref:hypothetical protein n=1 Tax=Mesorhizobium sp. M0400 TaxID=2956941 RepID=UPI00333D007F